ncbi:O-methyltransferase [Streptosporangiaceae bacterium NEAU-GS5]|nr:O-methyltransferase [Streptosporangiaceae bacterium NEAU-GS5]
MKSDDFLRSDIAAYAITHTTRPDDVLRDLAAETHERLGGAAGMQIPSDQGTLLYILASIIQPRLAVEVGTFTGYSSICVARALPEGGRLIACDVSEEWTSVARRYWERAGVADRIELRLGDAAATLRAMPVDETIDFAFIDADKEGYPVYYEEIMTRLRPGGLIAVDNTLQHGRIVDAEAGGTVPGMRAFNDLVAADKRATTVLLPFADGVTLIYKN